ncbi:MAG: hypothetical protein RI907_3928 [Pseudomonadota bacterium]|jgi:hypothetical protein
MLVVDLACPQGHRFEGWFASAEDLASQQARGLVTCPTCGDAHVQRMPSAPRLNVSHLDDAQSARRAAQAPEAVSPQAAEAQRAHEQLEALQAMYWSAVRHVVQNTEDVGERFASEARAMHQGEVEAKPIRGQLDADEREALKEEGIDVLTLVVPKGMDGPLQ